MLENGNKISIWKHSSNRGLNKKTPSEKYLIKVNIGYSMKFRGDCAKGIANEIPIKWKQEQSKGGHGQWKWK